MARKHEIAVGDKVGYSRAFLKSTGMFTGDIPRAKGIVTKLEPLGNNALATINWDLPDIPKRVLAGNLARVGTVSWAD